LPSTTGTGAAKLKSTGLISLGPAQGMPPLRPCSAVTWLLSMLTVSAPQ
jgi:hypothetical protein